MERIICLKFYSFDAPPLLFPPKARTLFLLTQKETGLRSLGSSYIMNSQPQYGQKHHSKFHLIQRMNQQNGFFFHIPFWIVCVYSIAQRPPSTNPRVGWLKMIAKIQVGSSIMSDNGFLLVLSREP